MSEQAPSVTLGKIIDGEVERDAIHFAVAPVVAAERLSPGQDVGVAEDGRASASAKPVGIVDPFLGRMVHEGQRCWLMLYPNTVTGMRHHWEHPAFDGPDVDASRAGLEYSDFVDIVEKFSASG